MSSHQPTANAHTTAGQFSAAEENKLDAAMRKADQILVASLKVDERRRRTRKLMLLTFGSLIMIAAGFVIFLSLLAGPSKDDIAKAENLSAEGWKLWQARQLVDAEAKFEEAVKADPTSASAWNGLGWSQKNQGKTDEAVKAYEKVIELEPDHPAALNGLGWIYFGKKDFEKAEPFWLKAAKNPNASAAFDGLATLYLLQGGFADAEKWAQKAVAAGDTSAKPLLEAAKAQKLDDKLRAQIEPKDDEQEKFSENAKKGWALLNTGKPKQAIMAFDDALKADSNDFSALNGMGFALLNSGRPAEAKEYFQRCLVLKPDAGGPMNGLAQCLKAEGKVDEAVALWKKMLDKNPGPNAATYGLAQHFEQEKYKEALPYLDQIVKSDPNNVQIKEMLEQAKAAAALK